MSARNCCECPNCETHYRRKRDEELSQIIEQYGAVTAVEYQKLLDDFKASDKPPTGDETLEEYYEHWFDDGKFHTYYNCHCDVCGFSFSLPRFATDLK